MIKHVVTMDRDDFTTLASLLARLRADMNELPDTFHKTEIRRCINEIEDLLGIEPPNIPEAITAKWRNYQQDHINLVGRAYCSNCGNGTMKPFGEAMPIICPRCKAVMTGVE